jgi:hypothetical protein
MSPTVREELQAIVAMTTPVLVRERRRAPISRAPVSDPLPSGEEVRSVLRGGGDNPDLPPDLRAQARRAADKADAALRLDAASKHRAERDQTRVEAKEPYEALPMVAQP